MKFELKNLSEMLFLDIETAALAKDFSELDEVSKSHWTKKASLLKTSTDIDFGSSKDFFYRRRAGIYAEFSRVVCISLGYVESNSKMVTCVKTKSFFDLDERELLINFKNFLVEYVEDFEAYPICGHNIKEFDIPFLCRRMLVHNIALPKLFNLSGKRPWQIHHLHDTMDLWRFGDFKNFTSLDLLCHILNVRSPKDETDGSKIHDLFWIEKAYFEIVEYCERDVSAVAQVFIRLNELNVAEEFYHESKTNPLLFL